MAAIRINSTDDLIRAYLSTLEYGEVDAERLSFFEDKIGADRDVVSALDDILYKKAVSVFCDMNLDKEQIVALFKFCFLQINDAKKWGIIIFEDKKLPEELVELLLKASPQVTPLSALACMVPQSIEPHTFKSAVKNLLGL